MTYLDTSAASDLGRHKYWAVRQQHPTPEALQAWEAEIEVPST